MTDRLAAPAAGVANDLEVAVRRDHHLARGLKAVRETGDAEAGRDGDGSTALLPLFDSGTAGNQLFHLMPDAQGEVSRARLDREKQLPVDEA